MIISIDEFKKTIPGYNPENAETYHSQSARLANQAFDSQLKIFAGKEVILLNGGSASGKSEFALTNLESNNTLIFDSTLSTIQGAKIKIGKILKFNKSPVVYSVIPDDIKRAFVAFLHRDRKFSDEHFYRTHSQSRRILLELYYQYQTIKVCIIESSYRKIRGGDSLEFKEVIFNSSNSYLKYLKNIQCSESDIISIINS